MRQKETNLVLGWLYPELMSIYGDRGNMLCLIKRCSWRNIGARVKPIEFETPEEDIRKCDLILGGGAQDRQQEMVAADLLKYKGKILIDMFKKGTPGLFVCGSPQLLGKYYITGDGKKLPGIGLFDYYTRHFGLDKPRCIGNTVGKISTKFQVPNTKFKDTIVGFENHGGRTYLGKEVEPFAKVVFGNGNNGEDGTEGATYKNVIACYYHGPFLPKNPHIADWLIAKALEVKYKRGVKLKELDDMLEWKAHDSMLKRLGVSS